MLSQLRTAYSQIEPITAALKAYDPPARRRDIQGEGCCFKVVPVMAGDLEEQIQHLERALGHLRMTSKQAFGFVDKVEFQGVQFDVSRRAVIADLSPLFFSHLIEHIDQEGIGAAVRRLYERLEPLLLCRHQWTPLKRASDEQVKGMARTAAGDVCTPHICKVCNAYVLGLEIPAVGRS